MSVSQSATMHAVLSEPPAANRAAGWVSPLPRAEVTAWRSLSPPTTLRHPQRLPPLDTVEKRKKLAAVSLTLTADG